MDSNTGLNEGQIRALLFSEPELRGVTGNSNQIINVSTNVGTD